MATRPGGALDTPGDRGAICCRQHSEQHGHGVSPPRAASPHSGSSPMRTRRTTLSLYGLCALALAGCSSQPAPQSAPTPATTAAAEPNKQWKPEDTEYYTPVPPIVTPGENGSPPSDAVVLLGKGGLDEWMLAKDGS